MAAIRPCVSAKLEMMIFSWLLSLAKLVYFETSESLQRKTVQFRECNYPCPFLSSSHFSPILLSSSNSIFLPKHTTKEPGGVLVFLPGQDDIEALQSLLEENLPNIVGQQYEEVLEGGNHEGDNVTVDSSRVLVGGVSVKKGILKDFEIWPLYAAMPPEEQVRAPKGD